MSDLEQELAAALEGPDSKPPTESPVLPVVGSTDWLPPVIVDRNIAALVEAAQPRIYAAPRRFDLPTIFVVTTAYAILFAAMGGLDWSILIRTYFAAFMTLVGLSQALLFGGKRPRTASVLTGATLLFLAVVAIWVANGIRRYPNPALVGAGTLAILGGALLGYLAGAFVGGVFLIADVLRGRFRREGS